MERQDVAPLAGAWIEIIQNLESRIPTLVAPLAGAWIEISQLLEPLYSLARRSPRGSVD